MYRILLAGDDLRLLETRAAVLEKTGSEVRWASRMEAEFFLRKEPFDMLILCHTLPAEQRNRLMMFARHRWPKIYILQLVSTTFEEQSADGQNDVRTSSCEPHHLVCRTERLLKEMNHNVTQPLLSIQHSAR
jgi:DNA-binding response OmpR family regulator